MSRALTSVIALLVAVASLHAGTDVTLEEVLARVATYRSEPGLDLLVPGEMQELYTLRKPEARIDGRATYSRFRQFTVTTTEKPKP